MKKNLFWLLALVFSASMTFVACEEDLCKDVECGANGACFEGSCECNQGFEGTNCETKWQAKYIGNYNASETCPPSTAVSTYSSSITAGADDFKISVSNFGDSGLFAILDITEAGVVTLPETAFANNLKVSGTGTYADGKLTVNYAAKNADGTTAFNCVAVMTKQ